MTDETKHTPLDSNEKASISLEFFSTARPEEVREWSTRDVIAHIYQAARMGSFSEELFTRFAKSPESEQRKIAEDLKEISREVSQ